MPTMPTKVEKYGICANACNGVCERAQDISLIDFNGFYLEFVGHKACEECRCCLILLSLRNSLNFAFSMRNSLTHTDRCCRCQRFYTRSAKHFSSWLWPLPSIGWQMKISAFTPKSTVGQLISNDLHGGHLSLDVEYFAR